MTNKGSYAHVGLPGLRELIKGLTLKECVKCEGHFQRREQIHFDIYNRSYCEACYKEVGEGDKE